MKQLIENSGYAFDAINSIWIRPGYSGIEYSDGEKLRFK